MRHTARSRPRIPQLSSLFTRSGKRRIVSLALSIGAGVLLVSCCWGSDCSSSSNDAFVPSVQISAGISPSCLSSTIIHQAGPCASPGNSGSVSDVSSPASPAAQASCQGSATPGAVGQMSYAGGALIGCANVVVLCLNVPCASYDGGDPCVFWNNFDASTRIHIADMYVNQTGDNRYVCANPSIEVDGVSTGPLSNQQFLDIITANLAGTGTNAVYNIFVSPAQFNDPKDCGYHFNAQINVSGQQSDVIYTVISIGGGCGSYANDMEHEMFESITDPGSDNSGWTDPTVSTNYNEIADVCFDTNAPITLGGVPYVLQTIWSIGQGACAGAPP